MTSGNRWAFKARFRARGYGWRGSALAGKRLNEAVREINSIAESAPVLAAEGCVSLMERLWPALQDIDQALPSVDILIQQWKGGGAKALAHARANHTLAGPYELSACGRTADCSAAL